MIASNMELANAFGQEGNNISQNDKSTYQGEWNNDKMQGFGIYHWADGSNYEGEWFENCMNGKGILT